MVSSYKIQLAMFIICSYLFSKGYGESMWVGPVWGLNDRRPSYHAPKKIRGSPSMFLPGKIKIISLYYFYIYDINS